MLKNISSTVMISSYFRALELVLIQNKGQCPNLKKKNLFCMLSLNKPLDQNDLS